MKATFILSLVMAILIAIFALLNGTAVPVSFGFATFESSLALVILISVAIGAVIIYLIDVVGKFKSARKIKDLEKKVAQLEKDIKEKASIITKLSQADGPSNPSQRAESKEAGSSSQSEHSTEKTAQTNKE